nr:ribonuclease H-like domain-containing protein [Tanacetum cinerariifolium]
YVRGTLDYGLQLFFSSTTDLVACLDVDWAGFPTTRRTTSGYCVFLGNNLLFWFAKRQSTLSHSNAEAEYRGVANAVAETCWLRNLLQIDIYFVRDLVAASQVRVLHVPSRYQFTYIFTKGLPLALFEEFHISLSIRSPPALTVGEWKQYATMMRQNKNLLDINIDAIYNILKQNQSDVNDVMKSKKKALVITSDPLGLVAEQTKKAKVKDYEYYKTKMLLAKKDKDEQLLLAGDHAWIESSSDSDQEINVNMVFMAQMEKVLSDSKESSSSKEETIAE